MKHLVAFAVTVATAVAAASASASPHTAPPPGATAQCRDSSYSYSVHRSGTCSHHGGVAIWLDGTTSQPVAVATGSDTDARAGSGSGACGVERWIVKTLQDRPQLLPPQATSLDFLITRTPPHPLPATRLPFERHVYTLDAAVSLVREEADSDLHLVLRAGRAHMIAEAPSASCAPKATQLRRQQMATARAHVEVCAHARITGVAFFDFKHGQTGVAPNAIELHPILGFRCLAK